MTIILSLLILFDCVCLLASQQWMPSVYEGILRISFRNLKYFFLTYALHFMLKMRLLSSKHCQEGSCVHWIPECLPCSLLMLFDTSWKTAILTHLSLFFVNRQLAVWKWLNHRENQYFGFETPNIGLVTPKIFATWSSCLMFIDMGNLPVMVLCKMQVFQTSFKLDLLSCAHQLETIFTDSKRCLVCHCIIDLCGAV